MRVGFCFFLFLLATTSVTMAQKISGKVTDAETGEGLPFVNVYFTGTTKGTTTDFEGYYQLDRIPGADSLTASYIGYDNFTKPLGPGATKLNFQLSGSSTELTTLEVVAGENPAWEILRKVQENRKTNDPRSVPAYNYESYTKLEFDVDNLTDKFRQKKVLRPITSIFDSLQLIAGEDGKMVMPVFISESISRFYRENDPDRTKEVIKASKLTGVGMDDGSLLAQLAGSSFQQYNFYRNWLGILNKNFISPIAAGWKGYYLYELMDSLYVGDSRCYKINVEPKRVQDLAFRGTIWITTDEFALKQIDVKVGKEANLNYIDKIKIQQEYTQAKEGIWLPSKSRVVIEVEKLSENWAGMIAKFYTSNRDFQVGKKREDEFFEEPVEVEDNSMNKADEYWDTARHDSLSSTELSVFRMVDSIRNIPMVKTYVEIGNILVNGYKEVGKFDLGPYLFLYNYNNVEGHRIRLGGRTNINFNKNLAFKGYLAYGTKDQRWKHMLQARYIFNRRPWTEVEVQTQKDIVQLGLIEENITDDNLFMAFSNFGRLRQPFRYEQHHFKFQTDLAKGLTTKLRFINKTYYPLYPFAYTYKDGVRENLTTSEVEISARYAYKEKYLLNDNKKVMVSRSRYPIPLITYSHGFSNVIGSQFDYDKISLNLSQKFRFGSLGNVKYSITAGKIFSTLPYPLLKVHLGNETIFHNQLSFNLMNYFEFVSDEYVSIIYQHHFMGQILNRIPLMKKLKWRLLGDVNILYGSLSQNNIDIIQNNNANGEEIATFNSLDRFKPYVEFGYGIENIFRLFRIEAMHRVTYYKKENVDNFGIRVAVQFEL